MLIVPHTLPATLRWKHVPPTLPYTLRWKHVTGQLGTYSSFENSRYNISTKVCVFISFPFISLQQIIIKSHVSKDLGKLQRNHCYMDHKTNNCLLALSLSKWKRRGAPGLSELLEPGSNWRSGWISSLLLPDPTNENLSNGKGKGGNTNGTQMEMK